MFTRYENKPEDAVWFDGLVPAHIEQGAMGSLLELNCQCLELLAEQSLAKFPRGCPLVEVGDLCGRLSARARARAAAVPFLLLDAGFGNPRLWHGIYTDKRPKSFESFFTLSRAQEVARQVAIFVWHLAQSKQFDAALLLGLQAERTRVIGSYTFLEMHKLVTGSSAWLSPRWPYQSGFWRNLLLAAGSGEFKLLEAARLHGLQLMAADVWAGSVVEALSPGSVTDEQRSDRM